MHDHYENHNHGTDVEHSTTEGRRNKGQETERRERKEKNPRQCQIPHPKHVGEEMLQRNCGRDDVDGRLIRHIRTAYGLGLATVEVQGIRYPGR